MTATTSDRRKTAPPPHRRAVEKRDRPLSQHKVFGIAGWKNSGKTTLVVALVEEFTRRGLRVSTIKHAHHDFDIDVAGKDSHRHRQAGATEVLVGSGTRWALMHELRGAAAPKLDELLSRLSPCDLVLVEGFKGDTHRKIEVAHGHGPDPLLAERDPSVLAVVTDHPERMPHRRTFPLNDISRIADFISEVCGLRQDCAVRQSHDSAS
ncbi:MAG: molybdopterin-guanine dinucleotide biosynthesis protein B [Alphaproteobacteria bacterium]|nr:molybdopterin-guanine dinucleotide biosynthesis protein B [Alphaproteobacteria bacterium]